MTSSKRVPRIAFYSHKGGVGKTTLSANTAFAFASLGRRVLILDTDPQCNLTAYLLADEVVNELLDKSDSSDGGTLWTAVRPLANGEGPIKTIVPYIANNVYLLPGDIKLSEFEQFLADAWNDSFKRRIGAIRAMNAFGQLIDEVAAAFKIDLVFYDTGPNIGPLNRAILLDCDGFVVPVACDLFSERALSTLGQAVKNWVLDWRTISSLSPGSVPLLPGMPEFLGYVPQNFRTYGQAMAKAPTFYLRRIERRIHRDLISVLQGVDPELAPRTVSESKLGQIKSFNRLVQQAQEAGCAIFEHDSASVQERREAKRAFVTLANSIESRLRTK